MRKFLGVLYRRSTKNESLEEGIPEDKEGCHCMDDHRDKQDVPVPAMQMVKLVIPGIFHHLLHEFNSNQAPARKKDEEKRKNVCDPRQIDND